MEGKYSFTSPEWDDITDAPKDLIRRLLTTDPERRATVRDALHHPFFQIMVQLCIKDIFIFSLFLSFKLQDSFIHSGSGVAIRAVGTLESFILFQT